ncbi:MAG: hypothetical protein HY975_02805 [Candidatus Kerfeldbacteria bacterium]|nr:hypothetical protein [Candidatus Kerfeldbacteria bacterium]
MPEVNLLKDTERLEPNSGKKPVPSGPPELTNPSVETSKGLGGMFRALFNRKPQTLPVTPAPNEQGKMNTNRASTTERILSEKRGRAPVIPLPEDEDSSYNVNLLSEDLITTVNPRQRMIQLGLIAIGAAVLVGLVYGGLMYYDTSVRKQIKTTQQELTDVQRQIATLKTEQQTIVSSTKKLEAIRSLIEHHSRWTNFFRLLEKYTLPTVTYGNSFTANQTGAITLSAKTNSYDEIAKQYLIWQQLVANHEFISTFAITGANAQEVKDGTVYSFNMTMSVLPSVLANSLENDAALRGVTATIPTIPGGPTL